MGVPVAATVTIGLFNPRTAIVGVPVAARVTVGGSGSGRIAGVPVDVAVTVGGYATSGTGGGLSSTDTSVVPFVITLGGVEISGITLTGFTFDATLSAVPSASITVVDYDGIVPWPPTPNDADPHAAAPELVIGPGALFSGPLTSWDREWIAGDTPGITEGRGPCWRYTLRAEGWQRLLSRSPVNPLTFPVDIVGPDGSITTSAGIKAPIHLAEALGFWTGPPLTLDASGVPEGTYIVSDEMLGSVLDMVAGRMADGIYWIDGSRTLHIRPGAPAHPRSRDIAPFHLSTVPGDGGVVPMTLHDSGNGGDMIDGIHVAGESAWTNVSVGGGVAYGGVETMQASTSGGPQLPAAGWAMLAGRMAMRGRTSWQRTLSATLAAGGPVPPLGSILGVLWDPIEPVMAYHLIRAVRGEMKVNGAGLGGVEWTLDLGDAERRSYVMRPAQAAAAVPEVKLQATHFECSQVSDMGKGSTQYIYGYPEDDKGNRVRLGEGTVEWTITLNNSDVGAGDEGIGWWIEDRHSALVRTVDKKSSYTYCLLHCGDNAAVGDAVGLSAALVTA